MEIWKDVIGYEGLYQVSNLGNVKSLERIVYEKNGNSRIVKDRILRPSINRYGYHCVRLYKQSSGKTFSIHRLVCLSFLGQNIEKQYVNHIDGNKANNDLKNLEWCTIKENNIHCYKAGLKKASKGDSHYRSKITEEQAKEIKYGYKGLTQNQIARLYGINRQSISKIRLGLNWSSI